MAKCSPCMSDEFKVAIIEKFNNKHITDLVNSIPSCSKGLTIQLCQGTRGPKEKRAPSEYNLFIKSCMQAKHLKGFDPGAMKDCAGQWKGRAK